MIGPLSAAMEKTLFSLAEDILNKSKAKELINTLDVNYDNIVRYLAVDEVAQNETGTISIYTAPEILLGWCLVLWYRTTPLNAVPQLVDALRHIGLTELAQHYFPHQ